MASLEAVYRGDVRMPVPAHRILAGVGVVIVGGIAVVLAMALATTGLGNSAFGLTGARRLAGAIGGIAVLVMIVGGFVALPATRETLLGAALGVIVALVGVALFVVVYPTHWLSAGGTLPTLVTVSVFVAGTILTLWSLFVAVATFQTRQHPGGSARLRVTETGRIELIETPDQGSLGGVGLFGMGEHDIEPQNRPGTPSGGPAPDGGSRSRADRPQNASSAEQPASATRPGANDASTPSPSGHDRYCGTCTHFRYENGTTPVCGFHERRLDDLDPCPDFE
ncbi:MAG: DUF7139 domain-containing protein [Halococcoides sp.]